MHRALLAVLILLGALHVSCESARAEDASCDTGFGKGAIASCTRLIETRTESTALSIAHNNRGTIYRQMGELDRAIADFNEAIRLDPKYTAAYTNRGRTYELKGDSERARVDFKAALALPQKYDNGKWAHDTARERLAALDAAPAAAAPPSAADIDACFKASGDEAISACTRLIASGQWSGAKLASGYNQRAYAYRMKGELDHAMADHDQALGLDPKSVTGYYGRGVIFARKGEFDRAIADFDQAIGLDPKNSFPYLDRGIAYGARGELDRAIADFDQAISLDPSNPATYTSRGTAYARKGDGARARADFTAALALPQKYSTGKWAHDTARARLAVLASPPAPTAEKREPTAPSLPAVPGFGRRVALVIGNSSYAAVPALPNPKRDAEAVAAGLREVGFQSVTVVNDASRDALVKALSAFGREADDADWALVYFAGHGLEVGGTNYLIPVDARLVSDRDVSTEAVSLDQLMTHVEGARKLRVVLLDACRENPFVAKMARRDAARSVGRGLARYEPASGSIVVYAAKEGQIALDGDAKNSPFAAAFLKNLRTPNLDVRRMFDLVRDDVMEATGRRQQPFAYSSVSGREEFYFLAGQR